jgi:hypothetical protein
LRGSMNGWTAQDDFEFVWHCKARDRPSTG